jgi:hypothetical protein
MTDTLIDIMVWIMWTVFIAVAGLFIGFEGGFQDGYTAGWNECISSLGGLLP